MFVLSSSSTLFRIFKLVPVSVGRDDVSFRLQLPRGVMNGTVLMEDYDRYCDGESNHFGLFLLLLLLLPASSSFCDELFSVGRDD